MEEKTVSRRARRDYERSEQVKKHHHGWRPEREASNRIARMWGRFIPSVATVGFRCRAPGRDRYHVVYVEGSFLPVLIEMAVLATPGRSPNNSLAQPCRDICHLRER